MCNVYGEQDHNSVLSRNVLAFCGNIKISGLTGVQTEEHVDVSETGNPRLLAWGWRSQCRDTTEVAVFHRLREWLGGLSIIW